MDSLVAKPGEFRTVGVGVFSGDTCIHLSLPVDLVPSHIAALLQRCRTVDVHPLIRSSVFHFELGFFHPFFVEFMLRINREALEGLSAENDIINDTLTAAEEWVLVEIRGNSKITNPELMECTGYFRLVITRTFISLKGKCRVERVVPRKNGA